MSFEITNSAKEELVRAIKEELLPEEFLRIARNFKCGDSKFKITIDEDVTKMDQILRFENFKLVVNQSELKLLENVILDFNEDGFIFNELNAFC